MLVKICGITNVDDARSALEAGADFIGLNMVGGPRRIGLDVASAIVASVPDPEHVVALLQCDGDREPFAFSSLVNRGVHCFQFYGPHAPHRSFPWGGHQIGVLHVRPVSGRESLDAVDAMLPACAASPPRFILLDAHSPDRLGGTGTRPDWALLAEARRSGRFDHWPPVMLAGGLNPENVAEAVALIRPDGVDVSSGVESSPGRKDPGKVLAFVNNAKARRAGS